jgi:hypothetical protein
MVRTSPLTYINLFENCKWNVVVTVILRLAQDKITWLC